MTSQHIEALNKELAKFGIKNKYYMDLRRNPDKWYDSMYKFLSRANPLYAIVGAFRFSSSSIDTDTLYKFNKEWIEIVISNKWSGRKSEGTNIERIFTALEILYDYGEKDLKYNIQIDHKKILVAVSIIDFSLVTGFWDGSKDKNSMDRMKAVVLEGIRRREDFIKNEDKSDEDRERCLRIADASIFAFDEYDESSIKAEEEERKKSEEEARKKAEEEERRKKEEEAMLILLENKRKKEAVMPILSSIHSAVDKFNWADAAKNILELVNVFNGLFSSSDLNDSNDDSENEDDASHSGKRLANNQISVRKDGAQCKFNVNSRLAKFLTSEGYINVSLCTIDKHTFIYFSKNPISNARPVLLSKRGSNYCFFSVSFANSLDRSFGNAGNTYSVISLSENKSNNPDIRRMEIISYE